MKPHHALRSFSVILLTCLSLAWIHPARVQAATPGRANAAPLPPTLVTPAQGGTNVPTSPTLTVNVSDPNADPITVSFYGRGLAGGSAAPPFTLAVLPDTQNYTVTANLQRIYTQQVQWVIDNRSALNIVMVSHLGDVVEHADTYPVEWKRASSAMGLLDDLGIPYGVIPGNHDMGPNDYLGYDSYFPPERYQGRSWYGGYLGDPMDGIDDFGVDRRNKDNYELFSADGMDFLVLNLEFDLPPFAVEWANAVLNAFPERRAMITTHAFLDGLSQRPAAAFNLTRRGMSAAEVWDQLIWSHCNVFLVLNGHYPSEAYRSDPNECGSPVYQFVQDYQDRPHGGDGWLRYYTFEPSQDEIEVYTFSPFLGRFEDDSNSRYTLAYPQEDSNAFTLIGSTTVISGVGASISWSGLANGVQYEWYAVASDGRKSTSSATWSFTTASFNSAPVCSPIPLTTVEDAAAEVSLTCTDADNDPLTYSLVTAPGNGSAALRGDRLTYLPDEHFFGSDGLQFQASDGKAASEIATVDISVAPVDNAPACQSFNIATAEDTAADLVNPCTDIDDAYLTYTVSQPAHGSVVVSGDTLHYVPAADFNGGDDFIYTANDGLVNSVAAQVHVTVNAINDAPILSQPLNQVNNKGEAISLQIEAHDPDGEPLVFTTSGLPPGIVLDAITGRISGNLSTVGNFAVTVTATDAQGSTGTKSFTWTIQEIVPLPVENMTSQGKVGHRSMTGMAMPPRSR